MNGSLPPAVARLGTVRFRQPSLDAVRFLPDGKGVVSSGDDGVVVWDYPAGTPLRRWTDHKGGSAHFALSADGRILASMALNDAEVRLRSVQTGKTVGVWSGPVVLM